jgi:hypothetical protein
MELSLLRPSKPGGTVPHVAFVPMLKGEHVQGDGGPYRQLFQDISAELQPDKEKREKSGDDLLGLLLPCTNQKDNEQIGKDRFVLNTLKTSNKDLNHFYFLGILMGICIRTGVSLPVDLPMSIWKKLVGQNLNIDDVKEVEIRQIKRLQTMLKSSKDAYEAL